MLIGKYRFRPGLVPTIVTVLLLALFVRLGYWQMSRADYKRTVQDDQKGNINKPLFHLTYRNADQPIKDIRSRQVAVKGSFAKDRQVALANVRYRNSHGFFMMAPFKLKDSDTYVLVNRGWKQQSAGFSTLPAFAPLPKGSVEIKGIVDTVPAVGMKLGEPDQGFNSWPKMVSYIDMTWYAKKISNSKFMPYVINQYPAGKVTDGLARDWKVFMNRYERMPPEKHQSYAFQWFSLALVLLGVYIGVNLKRANVQVQRES